MGVVIAVIAFLAIAGGAAYFLISRNHGSQASSLAVQSESSGTAATPMPQQTAVDQTAQTGIAFTCADVLPGVHFIKDRWNQYAGQLECDFGGTALPKYHMVITEGSIDAYTVAKSDFATTKNFQEIPNLGSGAFTNGLFLYVRSSNNKYTVSVLMAQGPSSNITSDPIISSLKTLDEALNKY